MAKSKLTDELLPTLLDRLTDNEPHRREVVSRQRTASLEQLRGSLLRDLGWLIDTGSLSQVQDLHNFPRMLRSVVNYGWLELGGSPVGSLDLYRIEHCLKQAIQDFEPRIRHDTLRVRVKTEQREGLAYGILAIEIEGDVHAEPAPLHLLLKTEIDPDTGEVRLSDEFD